MRIDQEENLRYTKEVYLAGIRFIEEKNRSSQFVLHSKYNNEQTKINQHTLQV